MRRNVILLSIILLAAFVFSGFAQSFDYVNIEESQNEIETLKTENQDSQNTINDLRRENDQLTKEINRDKARIFKLSDVITSGEQLLKSMKYILENTTNESYKAQFQGMIDETTSKLDTLKEKRKSLYESNETKQSKVDENTKQIRSLNEKISKNENRISYLEVAINNTQQLEDKMNAYVKKIDALIELLELETVDTDNEAEEIN